MRSWTADFRKGFEEGEFVGSGCDGIGAGACVGGGFGAFME